jgi:acyl carrier protein
MDATADKIRKIVAEYLGVDVEKVTDEAKLREDLDADSLDAVELVMAMEEEFGTEISDDDGEQIHTVGDLIKVVKKVKGES